METTTMGYIRIIGYILGLHKETSPACCKGFFVCVAGGHSQVMQGEADPPRRSNSTRSLDKWKDYWARPCRPSEAC